MRPRRIVLFRIFAAASALPLILASSGAALTASNQESPAERLRRAQGLMQQQQFAEAAELLDGITGEHPDRARAWMMLGQARLQLGEDESARSAFLRAVRFPATAPGAMVNLGIVEARRGDLDTAFAWLFAARHTGEIDVTTAGLRSAPESLREDPRLASLFPGEEELADPFVEEVEILREWRGESSEDQFGWIARNIGDVDGDGIDDVTTSAPSRAIGGPRAGKVYVYSSGTGELLWTRSGDPEDQLGLGIEAAGDVNADGIPDVIAGAPGAARAHVYSGDDGRTLRTFEGGEGDFFGRTVSDVGDVDGDGHDDVLVGASLHDGNGEDAGAVWIHSGADGSVLQRWQGEGAGDNFGSAAAGVVVGGRTVIVVGAGGAGPEGRGRAYVYRGLTDEPAFVIDAEESGAALGAMFVSVVGDVDADGVPDVYASDWADAALGGQTGRIYVHSGADGRRLIVAGGEAAGDGFGIGASDAGDVDGDGHDDLVVGAWQHDSAAPSGGKVYVLSGRDGSVMHTYTSKVMGETFGFDTTGMGDVDGDGTVDFLLTSAWSPTNGARTGRIFIVSGAPPER